MNTFECITVIRAGGRRLAKLIRPGGVVVGYDEAKHFDLFTVPVSDLAALHGLLHRLQRRPDCAVVRGQVADPARVTSVRRLLHPDEVAGDAPTLREAPRVWLALDVEGIERPEGTLANDVPACAGEAIARLPEAFLWASCIVQASGSHGLKPDIRLRLWYWLSRAVTAAELKYWLRGTPADPSVFGAVQPIYTAAPVFAPGLQDHLPHRIFKLTGNPVVAVPAADKLTPPPRPALVAPSVPKEGSARADLYVRQALRSAISRIIGADRRHPVILSEACGLSRLVHAGLLGRSEMKAVLWQAAQAAGKGDEAEIDRIVDFALERAGIASLPGGLVHG